MFGHPGTREKTEGKHFEKDEWKTTALQSAGKLLKI